MTASRWVWRWTGSAPWQRRLLAGSPMLAAQQRELATLLRARVAPRQPVGRLQPATTARPCAGAERSRRAAGAGAMLALAIPFAAGGMHDLFHRVLAWLVLAVLGALLAQVLLQGPGLRAGRFRGMDYTTTVAAGIGLLLAAAFVPRVAVDAVAAAIPRLGPASANAKRRARPLEGLLAYERGEHARRALCWRRPRMPATWIRSPARWRCVRANGDDASGERHLAGSRNAIPRCAPCCRRSAHCRPATPPLHWPRWMPPRRNRCRRAYLLLRGDALAVLERGWEAYELCSARCASNRPPMRRR